MQFTNIKKQKIFIYLTFFAIFLIGLGVYKDYGISIDDEIYRKNGEFYFEYIKIFFSEAQISSINDIKILSDKIVGEDNPFLDPVLFELSLAAISSLFNISESMNVFYLSHFINFLIFLLSLLFFFKLISKKFKSYLYGLFAVLVLFISPRFFAESFYNSRDIFFLSLFIFYLTATYNFLLKSNVINLIYFSFTSALLIYAKIIGIIPPIIFLFLYFLNLSKKDKLFKRELNLILLTIPLTFFFMYIIWPFLWNDPFNNFVYYFKEAIVTQNSHVALTYYFGDWISSTSTPWHYKIVWFFITTPLFISIFFIVGFLYVLFQIINGFLTMNKKRSDPWKNKEELFTFYLFFNLFIITFLVIKFNTSHFNGWRHLYFLYSIVIIFFLVGFRLVFSYFKNSLSKKIIFTLTTVNIIYISFWNYFYHPHQQVFFNFGVKNYAKKNFELDYWGLSNLDSIKYILMNNNNYPIKVATISYTSLYESTLMLDKKSKKKILITYNLDEADFLITNYMRKIRKNFVVDSSKYANYFEVIVNETPINTIYKKIK